MLRFALFFFALCVALADAARAQDASPETAERPVIGLVLGGGGALGLAHVGVIAELERAGIEPDIVVGASMGAVVGSLYASGYTAAEIEEIVAGLDWQTLFRDGAPRSKQLFRRKEEDLVFPISHRVGVTGRGLRFGRGLIHGRRLKERISSLLSARGAPTDFDALPRRFRAVATDIETFEPVVLGEGDLPTAVFASMAVPGLLPPVRFDDKMLIDGGLSSNVPIEAARALGADILIVVNLSTPPRTADEIRNVFDVVGQITAFMTLEKAKAEMATLGERDILLSPDLTGYSPRDFMKAEELIERGEAAASAQHDPLTRLAALAGAGERPPAIVVDPPRIASIRIENATTYPDELALETVSQPLGEPLDYARLERDLDRLYGADGFSMVSWRLDPREPGEADLVVDIQPTDIGDTYARFGLTLATDFDSNADFNFLAGLVRRNLNRRGGEVRAAVRIGDDPRLFGEFYQPTGPRQTWFVAVSGDLSRTFVRQFGDGARAFGELRHDFARLDLAGGRVFNRIVEARGGLAQEWGRVTNSVGFEGAAPLHYDDLSVFGRLAVDSFDHPFFPRRGALGSVEFRRSIGHDSLFNRSRVGGEFKVATPFAGGYLVPATEFGFALDEAAQLDDAALPAETVLGFETLGGPLRLSGLSQNALRGRHKALAALSYYRPIAGGEALSGVPLYLGASVEAGNVFLRIDDIEASDLIYGGSVFVGALTALGPVFFGVGYADGSTAAYLLIGRTF